ncbi:MAG: hypothetical protein ACM3XZ_09895 [Betaproteobacteria bacterium]
MNAILAERFGDEVRVRFLKADAPELAETQPEIRERLADPAVRLPLVVADGRVIMEGSFAAGAIMRYLTDGHIPKTPERHKVSGVPPQEGEPT